MERPMFTTFLEECVRLFARGQQSLAEPPNNEGLKGKHCIRYQLAVHHPLLLPARPKALIEGLSVEYEADPRTRGAFGQ